MSKTRRRHSRQVNKPTPRWFVPAAIAGAVVLVGAFLLWLFNQQQTVATSTDGAPRVAVDQTSLDFGDVRFEVPVEGVFRVSNVGTQPLTIVGEPIVELIEGC